MPEFPVRSDWIQLCVWARAGTTQHNGALRLQNLRLPDLPFDEHLSAQSLPPEFLDTFSCSCERSESCIDKDDCSYGARIFYFIGIHNNRTLSDAVYLFRGIRDSRNTILIHIDVKFDLKFYNNSTLKKENLSAPESSLLLVTPTTPSGQRARTFTKSTVNIC